MTMRIKFFMLLLVGVVQSSCGGQDLPGEFEVKAPPPDSLAAPGSEHEGIDLGIVVSSGIVGSANLPPPPDER